MKIKTIILWIIVAITGICLGYVWFGFLYPDPFYLTKAGLIGKLIFLWIPRIFIPILYFVLIALITIKNKKLVQNITILLSAVLVLVLILYPLIDIKYYLISKSENEENSQKYHPYLQLIPPDSDILHYHYGKNTIKIFCLGGSTTGFKDSKRVGWPERLEKELRKTYNSDSIFVFNFGKQWYTTLHSLINYETNLRQYKPDVIILMHNINDFLQNADFSYLSKGPFRKDYGHFYGPSSMIFLKTGLFGSFLKKVSPMWYHVPRITIEQDSFPGLESFTRNINTLIDLASMDGTKVVLLTQPNILSEDMDESIKQICLMVNFEAVGEKKRWGYQTAYIGMKQYNERIKAISENRKVYFIDLEKHIPKSITYFSDEFHYKDTTFNIISKTVADEIVNLKIIPER